ncbi:MAG: hypothetical protein V1859_09825 [archaeon]
MQKRGVSQIDWAMSLAIFILFIAWFFIFIRPSVEHGLGKETLQMAVKNGFSRDYLAVKSYVPLFIWSDSVGDNFPIIANFSFENPEFNIKEGYYYIVDRKKLIFLPNISGSPSVFHIIFDSNKTTTTDIYDLASSDNWCTTSEMLRATFTYSLLRRIYFNESLNLRDLNIYLNKDRLVPSGYSYNDSVIVARYYSYTEGINHTTYVYAKNSVVDTFADVNSPTENLSYLYELKFSMDNYNFYYSNNLYNSRLNFTEEKKNISYEADYITFHNSYDSLYVYFDRKVNISFEYFNETIDFNATFTLIDRANYRFYAHLGNYTNTTRKSYYSSYGAEQKISGLDFSKSGFPNYEELKTSWKFPSKNNFEILVYNSTTANVYKESSPIIIIGKNDTSKAGVYAKDYDSFMIDENDLLIPVSVNIKVW